MNSITKIGSIFLRNPRIQQQQCRGIQVTVKDNNLERALDLMERKMQESGMERLITNDQVHHLKNSEKRILAKKNLHHRLRAKDLATKLQTVISKKIRGV